MKYSSDIFNALLAMVLGGGSSGGGGGSSGGSVTVVEVTLDPQTGGATFGTKAGELYELCQAGPVAIHISMTGYDSYHNIVAFAAAEPAGAFYEFDYHDGFSGSIVPAIAFSADDYPTYNPSQS